MTNNELTLLKRYSYGKRNDYDVNPERRTWTDLVMVDTLDAYLV